MTTFGLEFTISFLAGLLIALIIYRLIYGKRWFRADVPSQE